MAKNQGLIAAMEGVNDTPELDETAAAGVALTVADDSAVVQADTDEAGTTVAQVEDAVQGGEELEEVAAVVADAVESGEGLSEETAEMASIAIESIRNRLGFPATAARLVPATESFGNTNTRLLSSKMVLESIGDTIKTIWANIKAAAIRLWDKIKTFFIGLFSSASSLSKHVIGLQTRARNVPSGAKPAEKKLKSSVAKAFSIKGKASKATADEVVKNTSFIAGVAKQIGGAQKDIAASANTLASGEINEARIKAFLADKAKGAKSIDDAMKAFGATDIGTSGLDQKAGKDKGTERSLAYGPFVNSTVLKVTFRDSEILGVKDTSINLAFEAAKGDHASEIEALDVAGVQSVLATALKLSNSLADFKVVQAEYDAITKSIVKVSDTIYASAQKLLEKTGSSSETRQGLQELKAGVNAAISSVGSFGNRGPALQFQTAKALADYASLSLRNLK